MKNNDFIKFICNQIVPLEIKFQENSFVISNEHFEYLEEKFDYKSEFSEDDIEYLKSISILIKNKQSIDEDFFLNKPLFKYWYLFTHEKYFKENIILDKHQRISVDNLKNEFLEILKIPIADVISSKLATKFKCKIISEKRIFLTCDFDIINIWDIWNYKNFIKEFIKSIIKLNFKLSKNLMLSFFLSRYFLKFNGYLNNSMFLKEKLLGEYRVQNIGFFISQPKNSIYDGVIKYDENTFNRFLSQTLEEYELEIGLHTNYDSSNTDSEVDIKSQIKECDNLFNVVPNKNRHHYLKFIFPSYLKKFENNIEFDFSLYFPELTIFRAGTCSEFKVWNFEMNKPFYTKIIPTTLMDGTFTDYLNVDKKKSLELAIEKLDLAMRYSNTIVLLWHNRSMYKYSNINNNFHPELYKGILKFIKTHNI